MRRKLIAANWKLHGSREMTASFLRELGAELVAKGHKSYDVLICPSDLYVEQATKTVADSGYEIFYRCAKFERTCRRCIYR
ncbi:MAG: triose-phosphate isomerase [Pseudomonadota bacterium]